MLRFFQAVSVMQAECTGLERTIELHQVVVILVVETDVFIAGLGCGLFL